MSRALSLLHSVGLMRLVFWKITVERNVWFNTGNGILGQRFTINTEERGGGGCMWSMRCNVKFVYQLSILTRNSRLTPCVASAKAAWQNTASNSSCVVEWRHCWRGPHRKHRIEQLLQCCMRFLAVALVLLRITQPLPSNGRFSGTTVLALSKYATVYVCNHEYSWRFDRFSSAVWCSLPIQLTKDRIWNMTNFLVVFLLSSFFSCPFRPAAWPRVDWILWDVLRILVACNEIFCYFNVWCWGVCGI